MIVLLKKIYIILTQQIIMKNGNHEIAQRTKKTI